MEWDYDRTIPSYGIKDSSNIESFFNTESSAGVFPCWVREQIEKGYYRDEEYHDNFSANTIIDSRDYRGMSLLPSNAISTNENLTEFSDIDVVFSASYDALKYQKVGVLRVFLQEIGARLANKEKKLYEKFIRNCGYPADYFVWGGKILCERVYSTKKENYEHVISIDKDTLLNGQFDNMRFSVTVGFNVLT